MSKDLAAYGWQPGRWAHFKCACCKDAFVAGSEFSGPRYFLASETSTTCRPCAQKAADAFAARDLPAERICAYEAVAKIILADLPHALRDGGGEGLEAALGEAAKAVRVWRELEALDGHP